MEITSDSVLTLVFAFIAGIVWLVRLEYMTKSNSKSIDELQTKVEVIEVRHQALDSKVMDQLTQIKISLAKIEGKLGIED